MSTVTVRHATAEDLPAVAAIYTHYVLRTTNTFNTEVRTPRQWRERFEENVAGGRQRLLVAEVARGVAGFVETQRLRPKAAYDRSVELSIYVAPDATGAGIGSALYRQLLHELEEDERFHRAYAIVALPNPTSVRFHERWGFVHRGTLTEAGHKFGRYLDVAYFERGV
ncbi:MAG: N-acetyltransferase family protein [Nitriliruptoraceae bacterium]